MKTKPEYGIVGAGSVSASLLGQLPRNPIALGGVGAVSYRVASRIANTLKAGYPVRSLAELSGHGLILFHAPPEHLNLLSESLASAEISWPGKCLVFCDCKDSPASAIFQTLGASVATVRRCGLQGRLAVEGAAPALHQAVRLVRELNLKPVILAEGSDALFDAAVTLGSAALTPVIDAVARIFRSCGIRDQEAVDLAASLFTKTAGDYAHSGRQSWRWHAQQPVAQDVLLQIDALDEPFRTVLARLVLAGFHTFDRHAEVARNIAILEP